MAFYSDKVDDEIYAGNQPSNDDIKQLSTTVKSVINVRPSTEEGFVDEQPTVESLNLKYANTPLNSLGEISAQVADQFIEAMDSAPKPVFVHCKLGGRAKVLSLIYESLKNGYSYEKTLQRETELKVPFPNDDVKEKVHKFYREYLPSIY